MKIAVVPIGLAAVKTAVRVQLFLSLVCADPAHSVKPKLLEETGNELDRVDGHIAATVAASGGLMKYIERGWESYMKYVMPKDAPPVQVKETRQAFYSGAAVLFWTLMMDLDEDHEPTDEDLQKMENLQKEIDAFGQQLDFELLGIRRH